MEAGEWQYVNEIIATLPFTPEDLEKKHGDKEDTLLIKAARLGKEGELQVLLNAGAAIEATNKGGATALYIAAQEGHLPALQLLLEKGAAIDVKVTGGATVLYCAAKKGHLRAVETLLDRGADIEARTEKFGNTPLTISATNGHSEVVALLCQRGANIEAQTKGGATALYCAAGQGHLRAVEILLDRGADIEARDEQFGNTPLTISATNGHSEVVALLCQRGANIEARTDDGSTALYCAADEGNLKAVEILLDRGADIEAGEEEVGFTPLIRSAIQGHFEIVALLCQRGANIEARDNAGRNALDWAEYDMVQFLKAWSQQAKSGPAMAFQAKLPTKSSTGYVNSSSVPSDYVLLADLQAGQVRVLIENLKIPHLVTPFENNYVDGALLDLVESPEDIVDIDSSLIKGIYARKFFYILKAWIEDGGRIPRSIITPSKQPYLDSVTTENANKFIRADDGRRVPGSALTQSQPSSAQNSSPAKCDRGPSPRTPSIEADNAFSSESMLR